MSVNKVLGLLFVLLLLSEYGSKALKSQLHSSNTHDSTNDFDEPSISIPLDSHANNITAAVNVFQRIRPFVYPPSFRPNEPHASMDLRNHRNITPHVIQANTSEEINAKPTYTAELLGVIRDNSRVNEMHPYSADVGDLQPKFGSFDLEVYQQQQQQQQMLDHGQRHAYTMAVPAANASLVGGLLGLLDPIVLMTVLWLVVFLVNSLLSVIDQLNLLKATKLKVEKMNNDSGYEKINDRQNINDVVLNNLEKVLHIAYDLYDKKLHQQ